LVLDDSARSLGELIQEIRASVNRVIRSKCKSKLVYNSIPPSQGTTERDVVVRAQPTSPMYLHYQDEEFSWGE
jgi:hypothetical protein